MFYLITRALLHRKPNIHPHLTRCPDRSVHPDFLTSVLPTSNIDGSFTFECMNGKRKEKSQNTNRLTNYYPLTTSANKYITQRSVVMDNSPIRFTNKTLKIPEKPHLLFVLIGSPGPGVVAGCFERGGEGVQRLLGGY